MSKRKKKWIKVVCGLLLAVCVGILCAKPAVKLYRNLSYSSKEHTATEIKVKEYAEKHSLTYGDYPQRLIELLERNPETEAFVLEYPLWEEQDWDLSEYKGSATVPLFLQWDQRWGYEIYGGDVMGLTGCGPTCLAMVGYYLTGDESFSPAKIAVFAEHNGYYSWGNGSKWTLISEGSAKLGLKATELPLVVKKMTDALEAGKPIIVSVGAGDFTTTGHYIVITGVEDGLFRVNDPNSRTNSEKLWSFEQLEPQIRNLWAIEVA